MRWARPPCNFKFRFLQPLCVLIEHRIDDVNKRFVAGKETVTPGENVPLKPSLQRVLTEHLHHPSVASYLTSIGVFRLERGKPRFLARLVDCLQPVRGILVRTEDTEIVHVATHDISKEAAE